MFIEWFFNELDYSLSNVVSHVFEPLIYVCIMYGERNFYLIGLVCRCHYYHYSLNRDHFASWVSLLVPFIYGCEETKIKAFIVWIRRVGDTIQFPRIVESFLCVSFDKCWFPMMTVMRCDAFRASKISASNLISNSETFTFGIWFVRPPNKRWRVQQTN